MSGKASGARPPAYVLDTSALLTLAGDEPGAEQVQALLHRARRRDVILYLSFMSVMEAGYQAFQATGDEGLAKLLAFLEELPLQRVDVTDALISQAAICKGTFRLSVAAAWILATAKSYGATLVHKDPEFEQARAQVTLLALPYKHAAR